MSETPDILDTLSRCRLLPVVSIPDAEFADPLADALLEAGLACIEVTFRTAAAEASIRKLAERGDLFVAAGTVMNREQAQRAHNAGASCLLSPGTDAQIIQWCQANQIRMIPGVATPTEIITAQQMGLDLLKFFPAETNGGAKALQALAGPFPDCRFVPTGGISLTNLQSYLACPNVVACGGSWVVQKQWLAERSFTTIRDSVKEAISVMDGD